MTSPRGTARRFRHGTKPSSMPPSPTSTATTLALGSPKDASLVLERAPRSILKTQSCSCRRSMKEKDARKKEGGDRPAIRRNVTFSGLDKAHTMCRWDSCGGLKQMQHSSRGGLQGLARSSSRTSPTTVSGKNATWTSFQTKTNKDNSSTTPTTRLSSLTTTPRVLSPTAPVDHNCIGSSTSHPDRETPTFRRLESDSSIPCRKPQRRASLTESEEATKATAHAFQSLTCSFLDLHRNHTFPPSHTAV